MYQVPLSHIWEAYDECMKNKANTLNATLFAVNAERNLQALRRSINDRTYDFDKSVAFIVEKPVKREVFAAGFKDRIVQHFLYLRVNPLFEAFLSDKMYSNRVGRGTLYAIYNVYRDMQAATEGYTNDAWIWKFDLKGFFMSIDKRILCQKLLAFLEERYHGEDKEVVLWLVEKVIMHCPQKHCYRKTPMKSWDGLRADKSLFTQDDFHGLPIGNIMSQICANFLLMGMVVYLEENGFCFVTQYVDDCVVISPSKQKVLEFIPKFRAWLWESLGITLHPNKCYIQHYTKGVSFVGGIIKPHRVYLSKRTYGKMLSIAHAIANSYAEPFEILATVNSYLGLSQHFASFNIRQKFAMILASLYGGRVAFVGACKSMELNYKDKEIFKRLNI